MPVAGSLADIPQMDHNFWYRVSFTAACSNFGRYFPGFAAKPL